MLQGAGFTAICAVITEYAGRLNRWDVALGGRRFAHLAWRDIERWVGRGITFVSHTATHRRLTALPASEVARECARSREVLGAVLGVPPRALCYPFGSARGRERVIARREGYDMAFVLDARWGGNMMAIPRTPVYPWTTVAPCGGARAAIDHVTASLVSRLSTAGNVWRSLA